MQHYNPAAIQDAVEAAEVAIQHSDEPTPEVETTASVLPKLNKAQQLLMLCHSYIANPKQLAILTPKARPAVSEEEQKAAEEKEAARKLVIFTWNQNVEKKKLDRLKARLARRKAALGLV